MSTEFILFVLLEPILDDYFRAELVPGCIRFHEVKWKAVLSQIKEH